MATLRSRYMVVEVTDLRTKAKSFKIYERDETKHPLMVGLATRAEAEAKVRDMEAEEEAS